MIEKQNGTRQEQGKKACKKRSKKTGKNYAKIAIN